MEMVMRGTLFVDASYHAESKASGYGAWFKTSDMEAGSLFGGRFKTTMQTSGEAELAGIAKAIARLHKAGSMVGLKVLMVQCDNIRALSILAARVDDAVINNHESSVGFVENKHKLSEIEVLALSVVQRIVKEGGTKLELRPVKGHAYGEGRHWVSRQCDRIAREHMIEDRRSRGWGTRKRKKRRRLQLAASPAGSGSSCSTGQPGPGKTPSSD